MAALALVAFTWLAAAPVAAQALAPSAPLPIRRVVLYASGVAFVERRGRVVGRAEVRLPLKPSQVDDVLKSLVVLDLAHGRMGSVAYDTPAPAEAALGEVPFRLAPATGGDYGKGGLAEVLRQLQGAQIAVTTADGPLRGRVLTVEARRGDGQSVAPSAHLVLADTDDGALASVDLSRVRTARILEAAARRDLAAFARGVAAARRHDATTILVSSQGSGERELVMGYTTAAPVWKTTYRVALDAAGSPFVQGWAIVDNASGDDWNDVRLSLVSGSPLSFVQHLQQPLFQHRPVLALPEGLRPEPQVIGLVRPDLAAQEGLELGAEGGVEGGVPGGVVGGIVGGLPFVAPLEVPATTLSDAVASGTSGVEARTRPVEAGDLFDYRVEGPVSVPSGRSALIPILQERLSGERVSLWSPRHQRGERPLAALRLHNTSKLLLDEGPISVLDGDIFAGEGQLDRLRPGEEQLVTYAVDLTTRVETRSEDGRQPAFLVRIKEGSFEAHFHRTRTTTYSLTNQAQTPRVLYLEQQRSAQWDLAESGPSPVLKSREAWRFRVELAPGARVELPVTERLALVEKWVLSSLSATSLRTFEARGLLDATSRTGLDRVLGLRLRIASLEEQAAAAEREAAEIATDQARLRENLKAVGDRRDAREIAARWLTRTGAQEARLEALRELRRRSEAERQSLREELDAVVRGLEGERRLPESRV